MSLNVGTLAAKLGLETGDFLEKMKGATGATKYFSDEMRRSTQQSSREASESLRFFDEAIGLHLSRPLTRLITSEFPAFGAALQSMLGLGAASALSAVGFEAFEKISKGIEKAQRAQEELRTATANTNSVFSQEINGYRDKDKAVSSATEKVNKLIEAEEKQTAAMLAASGPWNHMLASIGDFAHQTFSFQSTLNIEATSKQLDEFKRKFDSLALTDSFKGSHDAMKLLADEIRIAGKNYDELKAKSAVPMKFYYAGPGAGPAPTQNRITPEELAAADKYKDDLKKISDLWNTILAAVRGKEAESAALQRTREAAAAAAGLSHTMAEAVKKLEPETNPLKKISAEIDSFTDKAEHDFYLLGKTSNSALQLRQAEASLDSYEGHLQRILAKAKADADVLAAQAKLPNTIAPTGQAPTFAAPSAMPSGPPMSTSGAKFDAFAGDQAAQLKRAAEAYELAMTAQDKYELGVRELDLLVQKGLISSAAQKAAMSELDVQMLKEADSTHKLQTEMQKLLERSNDATAGLKAFAIQLQLAGAENGKFTYDILNAATKGAEDNATKTLFDILGENRGGHRQLIADLESMWAGYFKSLASMALKFQMDKMLAPIGKALAPGDQQNAGQPQSGTSTSSTSIWGKIFGAAAPKAAPTVGGTGADSLIRAGTMLQTSATALQKAASALSASSGGGMGGAAGAGGDSGGGTPWESLVPSLGTFSGFFANGGDATPGSNFISGEAGPEEVNLDGRGGAHITPLGVAATGGDTHNHYDMRGAIVADDVMRRAEGHAAIHASEGRMLSAMPAMQREINLRKRS